MAPRTKRPSQMTEQTLHQELCTTTGQRVCAEAPTSHARDTDKRKTSRPNKHTLNEGSHVPHFSNWVYVMPSHKSQHCAIELLLTLNCFAILCFRSSASLKPKSTLACFCLPRWFPPHPPTPPPYHERWLRIGSPHTPFERRGHL